jgi:hypothetical protein
MVRLLDSQRQFPVRRTFCKRSEIETPGLSAVLAYQAVFKTKPPGGICSPDGFASVGPDDGGIVRYVDRR